MVSEDTRHEDEVGKLVDRMKKQRTSGAKVDHFVENFLRQVHQCAPSAYAETCAQVYPEDCAGTRAVIRASMADLTLHSKETGLHVRQVLKLTGQCTEALIKAKMMTPRDGAGLCIAAIGHDIGKLISPQSILHKPGKFNSEEQEIVQRHADDGHAITDQLMRPSMQGSINHMGRHHRKMDGSGYGAELQGASLTMNDKVLQISDMFEAMTGERGHQVPMKTSKAIEVLRKQARAGKLDSELLETLLPTIRAFGEERENKKPRRASDILLVDDTRGHTDTKHARTIEREHRRRATGNQL